MKTIVAILAVAIAVVPNMVRAQTVVSLELVLAVDSSISIDAFEYKLQMKGIASAFRDPDVIDLIEREKGVVVTLYQWSSVIDEDRMIPWQLLHDRAGIYAFAERIEAMERNPHRQFTGIGRAIDFGIRLIVNNAYAGEHLKIDVSGDGSDNINSLLAGTHRRAAEHGIVINGLPILSNSKRLESYYERRVIAGPGAFVEVAADYDDFARAFLNKLIRELTPRPLS